MQCDPLGGNLVGLGYGDVPLFTGTFVCKVRNYGHQFWKYVGNYGYHLKKHAKLIYHIIEIFEQRT